MREQKRERKKEERLSRKNYFGIKDLTPMNAINRMINITTGVIQYR